MTLPTFVGIGAPRCGSTWLHELLSHHPEVFVPPGRKELRFFDLYYERGLAWYERFFPPDSEAGQYRAIGEFSPTYLYGPACPDRIASIPSITRLILILRNPVDRAYSRYGFHVRYENFAGSFEDFLEQEPYAIEEGFYSEPLVRFQKRFGKERILTLVYEQAVGENVPRTKETVAQHLGIRAGRFPPEAGYRRVNVGYSPKRWRAVYAAGTTIARKLQERSTAFDWTVELAKRLSLRRVFGSSDALPRMKEETRENLKAVYQRERAQLEVLLGLDLSCWH